MSLVTIFRPQTESDLAIAVSILESHEIYHFVHGQYLGSILPGLQIDSYNTRSIMVPEECAVEAMELLMVLTPALESAETTNITSPTRLRDKIRVIAEALLFGWFVPGGRRSK